ncbi:MAG: hypothetical protein FE78DRAFT_146382, partial [Acidomyces sp. 'richmondensis']
MPLDEKDGNLRRVKSGEAGTESAYQADPNDLELGRTKTQQSASSKVLAGKQQERQNSYSLWRLIKLVASFNKQEWHIMLLGLGASLITGGGQPAQSVFFAKAITALALPPSQYGRLRSQANFWSWMYFMLALVQLFSFMVQGVSFAYCSERLVHRSRDRSFRSMLRQDIQFFDREENTAGALTSFLSTETTHLAGMSGVTLGT